MILFTCIIIIIETLLQLPLSLRKVQVYDSTKIEELRQLNSTRWTYCVKRDILQVFLSRNGILFKNSRRRDMEVGDPVL